MAIYLAVPLASSPSELNDAVQSKILPKDFHKLQSDRGWLIKFDGTAIELSNHLGITGQAPGETSTVGSSVIVSVTSYYGRGPADMWEWLKTRFEQQ